MTAVLSVFVSGEEGDERRILGAFSIFNDLVPDTTKFKLPIVAPLVLADPIQANMPLKNRSALRGSIVLSLRGEVSFTEKVKRVRQLGGIAAIVGNNDERHPHSLFAMSGAAARPSFGENEIPSLMISYEASQDLLKLLKKCDREVQVKLELLTPEMISSIPRWHMGNAVRAATIMKDVPLLQSLLDLEVNASGRGQEKAAYNEKDIDRGANPLHLSVEHGGMETLTLLMQAGAMLDARRCDDFLPVHVAASKGSTSILALLLDAGAYPDATHRLGWTALHFAAHQGHVECMDLLVTKGANLDSQANDGCTPLMLSILFKQPAALKFLLEKGADRHLVNNQGYSAESFALQHDNVEAQAMLSHAKEEVFVPLCLEGPLLKPLKDTPEIEYNNEVKSKREDGRCLNPLHKPQCRCPCAALHPDMCLVLAPMKKASSGTWVEDGGNFLGKDSHGIRNGDEEELVADLKVLSTSHTLPPLKTRRLLGLGQISAERRAALWLLMRKGVDGEKDKFEPDEEGLRVRALYQDLGRNKFEKYREGAEMDRVKHLILTWLREDKKREYKQGLTILAASVLEVFAVGREDEALDCLTNLIERHMYGMYRVNASLDKLGIRFFSLHRLLLYWDPDLSSHLLKMDVIGELYATPWFVTLFSDILPMEQVLPLWDIFLNCHPSFVTAFACAVVLSLRERLLLEDNQCSALVLFSGINADASTLPLTNCLAKAIDIYGCTPAGVLDLETPSDAAADILDFGSLIPFTTIEDVKELGAEVCIIDIRDGSTGHSIKKLWKEATVIELPYSICKYQVRYCCELTVPQRHMRPPQPLQELARKYHMVVYSDEMDLALEFARMLIFSHVPCVSILETLSTQQHDT